MAVNRAQLENVLKSNIVEIKWVRRIPKDGHSVTRRALATNSYGFLNSEPGRTIYRFSPPTQANILNTSALNLVTYYDLFRMNYRNISCESAQILKIIPISTPDQQKEWWAFFAKYTQSMNTADRFQFINS